MGEREERLYQAWPEKAGSEFAHRLCHLGGVSRRGKRLMDGWIDCYLTFSNQVTPLMYKCELVNGLDSG